MDVSIDEAKERLADLIHAVEEGEKVIITRDGQAVAQIAPPPPAAERRQVRFGTMRGRIHLKPGWDDPITEDQFISGDF
jgi:prevent-host-death family protein